MRFSLLVVTGLVTFGAALPQRPRSIQDIGAGSQALDFSSRFASNGVQSSAGGLDTRQTGSQGSTNEDISDDFQQISEVQRSQKQNTQDRNSQNRTGQTSNKGNQTSNTGSQTSNSGNQTSNAGNQTSNAGNQTSNAGNQTSNAGNQTSSTGNQTAGAFDASLVPQFGIQAGQSPDGKGNCLGVNNVKIPCSCPPDRQLFIQKVQAAAAAQNSDGVPVKFPLDNSKASQKARIQTSVIVLQNLNGRGVGCPAAATTFLAQIAALSG